jgi:hypothetical protein
MCVSYTGLQPQGPARVNNVFIVWYDKPPQPSCGYQLFYSNDSGAAFVHSNGEREQPDIFYGHIK